jgi:hypothetical protein
MSLKQIVLPTLTLFGSFSTLLCCALPALLVSLGAGAIMVGLVSAAPQLVWLSAHKKFLFAAAGILLALSGGSTWLARNAPCPADPAQAAACRKLRRVSSAIFAVSAAMYAVGFFSRLSWNGLFEANSRLPHFPMHESKPEFCLTELLIFDKIGIVFQAWRLKMTVHVVTEFGISEGEFSLRGAVLEQPAKSSWPSYADPEADASPIASQSDYFTSTAFDEVAAQQGKTIYVEFNKKTGTVTGVFNQHDRIPAPIAPGLSVEAVTVHPDFKALKQDLEKTPRWMQPAVV